MQPETEDVVHGVAQIGKLRALPDVGVHMEVVRFGHVGNLIGVGEDHHRNAAKEGVCFDIREHVKAVLPRHMEIQQQQVRDTAAGLGMLFECVNRLMAVLNGFEVVRDSSPLQCNLYQARNRGIVFSEHNTSPSILPVVCNHLKLMTHPRIWPANAPGGLHQLYEYNVNINGYVS